MLTRWKESYDQPRQHIKKQRHYFANKGPSSQGYGFFSSHVWMWELNYKESWVLKNWCFWTVVWRRLLRVPWTSRRSKQFILKEISLEGLNQEGLMLKLKFQYFGHLMGRTDSLEKILMLQKIEGLRRRGRQEDEMVGWHHRLNGLNRFGWTPGVGGRQGDQACCGSWGHKESDTTEPLNWTVLNGVQVSFPKKIFVWGRSGITEVKWTSYLCLFSKGEEDAYRVGFGVLDLKGDSGWDLRCWQFLILNGDLRRLWISPKRNEDMNTYPVRNKRQQKRKTSQWKACWKPMGMCGWPKGRGIWIVTWGGCWAVGALYTRRCLRQISLNTFLFFLIMRVG